LVRMGDDAPGSDGSVEADSTAATDPGAVGADDPDAVGSEAPATDENGWPIWDASHGAEQGGGAAGNARPPVVVAQTAGADGKGSGSKARIDEVLAFIDEPPQDRRRPVVIAAVVFLGATAILAAAVIPELRDSSSDTSTDAAGSGGGLDAPDLNESVEPTADLAAQALPTATALSTATPAPTAIPVPAATATPTATPEPTPAPTAPPVPPPTPTEVPEDDAEVAGVSTEDVPESKAVVLGGKIYLEGAVPDEASAQAIVDLAAAVLGPENVINNYIIDPRAGDPNLGNIRVDDTVLFETNSDVIAIEFEPLLNQALALMSLRPSVTLTIVGHTDSVGPDAYNLGLSILRAESVVAWLAERGVDPTRLTAAGAGEAEPIATNDTDEGRQFNRRIQVFIENLLSDE